MLLSELFRGEGADVYEAEHGYAALEIFEAERFDLICLDLKMPDMNGIEVLRAIRKLDKSVPVILITAYVEPVKMEEATVLGVYKFLTKPFDIDELRDDIRDIIKRRAVWCTELSNELG